MLEGHANTAVLLPNLKALCEVHLCWTACRCGHAFHLQKQLNRAAQLTSHQDTSGSCILKQKCESMLQAHVWIFQSGSAEAS